MRNASPPIPSNQQMGGGVVVTMVDNNSGSGNVNMSHDQMPNMLPASSTPPSPAPAPPNSMGLSGPGTNMVASYSIGSTSSSLTTSITNSAANRNVVATSNATNLFNSNSGLNREQVYSWIQELSAPDTRERVLIELSRKRELLPDLAPMLWHSFGAIAALLQEIVMIYPVINPPTLNVSKDKC